ncbi:MAG: tyrosine-protein kinase Etk/Wzc [Urechidicola sp.]|jgi:tyrosine-protein kinase Etk/Wzc|tara:strand:+ start:4950 stop:7334 length:2385 start_codon:yes stop_codon:yes gene_type:complete
MEGNNENVEAFSDNNIVLKDLLGNYTRNWKWFVIGASLCFITAYLYLRHIAPQYQVNSSIKIKDDSSNGAISELAVFEDMGMLMNQQSNVENEIAIVKSRNLLGELVKDLEMNVQFFEKGKTFLEDALSLFSTNPIYKELYKNTPINIDFLEHDSIVYNNSANFEITLISESEFIFYELNSSKQKKVAYGNKISTAVGDIIITPNLLQNAKFINKTVVIKLWPVRYIIDYLRGGVQIVPVKNTDIVNIGIRTQVKQKGIDILNHLIAKYNNDAVTEKSIISKNTSDFISNRLKVVSDELSLVDKSIADYRRDNKIINTESQSGLNLQNESANNQRINDVNNQMSMIEAMEQYMETQDGVTILPENLGLSDASLANSTGKHNELVFRRNELLKSVSEKHPAIVNLDEQIGSLKGTINQSIGSIKNTTRITINSLNKQDALLNSKLFSVPQKERGLTDITRQQNIKESLYLYLLQKREEIAISLGITTVNAKIIDSAFGSSYPVYPDRKIILPVSLLLGLIIPFLILYILELIDTKVHKREDIEKVLRLPILGDIPLTKKKKRIVKKLDRSGLAESFRLLKTNLDFMLRISSKKSKVIVVTSTIGNEGKTFIATNLAKTLAYSDSKVLLLGLDLRAPTISKSLKIKKGIGITNFITDKNITLQDIVIQLPEVDNLDIITSGVIPPNPTQLIMSQRLEDLFETVNDKYDYIIVDSPPVSLVTDTILLDKFADLFMYVVRAEKLDKRMLKVPFTLHRDNKINNVAMLLNGIKQSNNNYGYGYGYGNELNKPWYKKIFS